MWWVSAGCTKTLAPPADAAIVDVAAPDATAAHGAAQDAPIPDADACRCPGPCDGGRCLRAVALTAGDRHTCALLDDQSVRCWGDNSLAQIGAGAGAAPSRPTAPRGLHDVRALAAGDVHTCAARADGSVWCWGIGQSGQSGDGARVRRYVPVAVRW